MKRVVLIGTLIWALLISAAHVQLNIGWHELARQMRVLFGGERKSLEVGFLPVT